MEKSMEKNEKWQKIKIEKIPVGAGMGGGGGAEKNQLRVGESNPALPRSKWIEDAPCDRRVYWPIYERGLWPRQPDIR